MSDVATPTGSRPRRPFHLIHAMGFVAAVALTLAVPPAIMGWVIRSSYRDPSLLDEYPGVIEGSITLAMALWSFAASVGMLVAGRRRLRRVARTLGGSAALASTAGIAAMNTGWVVDLFVLRKLGQLPVGETFEPLSLLWWGQVMGSTVNDIPGAAGLAVVGAWTVLAIARMARKPSGWLEVVGLILGMAWIVWPVIMYVVRYALFRRILFGL